MTHSFLWAARPGQATSNMIALLRHGWSLAYSQPGLLFYAVLVSLLSAQWLRVGGSVALTEEQLNALSANLLDIDSATILTALTVVVLSFSVYWLLAILGGNWSLAALIHGLGNAEQGATASFTAAGGAGVRYFWQVLVVGLITTGLLLLILTVGAGLALGALFTRQSRFHAVAPGMVPGGAGRRIGANRPDTASANTRSPDLMQRADCAQACCRLGATSPLAPAVRMACCRCVYWLAHKRFRCLAHSAHSNTCSREPGHPAVCQPAGSTVAAPNVRIGRHHWRGRRVAATVAVGCPIRGFAAIVTHPQRINATT